MGLREDAEDLQKQLVDMSIREFDEHEEFTLISKNLLAPSLWRRGR
jgi:hypothetical protein